MAYDSLSPHRLPERRVAYAGLRQGRFPSPAEDVKEKLDQVKQLVDILE